MTSEEYFAAWDAGIAVQKWLMIVSCSLTTLCVVYEFIELRKAEKRRESNQISKKR